MPFFGSKKEKQPSKTGGPGGGYPQQSPYPTQPSAPAGHAASGEQPPPYAPHGQAPPPQYQATGVPPQPQYAPPQSQHGPPPQQQYYGQPAYYPQQPQYGYAPQGMHYPMHPQIPHGAQVVGHGTFDAGARFNSGAGMNIPPPPPGAMPTAAQYAAAYGGTVNMGQAKAGFFSGGSGGGVSTHFD